MRVVASLSTAELAVRIACAKEAVEFVLRELGDEAGEQLSLCR